MQTRSITVQKLTVAALCLALCLVLPFLTGQIPEIGNALCPMHLPVLLCGFVAGPAWGAGVGAVAPLLRFVLFGMPPLFPTGLAMCFELATYGLVCGLMIARLPRKPISIYAALITAMLAGRVVWGVARVIFSGVTGSAFTWAAFLAGAFTSAVAGIIVQLVLVPIIVLALQRALPWLKSK